MNCCLNHKETEQEKTERIRETGLISEFEQEDLTKYTINELSLRVYNTEELYKIRFSKDLRESIEEMFIFTEEQEQVLLNDLKAEEETDFSSFMEEELKKNFEKDLNEDYKALIKTFKEDKRGFIKCCDICLSGDKDFIHLYFINTLTNRKSKKFIEIREDYLNYLFSFDKKTIYAFIEDRLNLIEIEK